MPAPLAKGQSSTSPPLISLEQVPAWYLIFEGENPLDYHLFSPSKPSANIPPNLGLIISLSVLFAAGLAVYENPQVRQWVDSSRRKIAIALHSLGDEITPLSTYSHSSFTAADASTREDEAPDAVERRRKAREEILERGRMLEEKRRSRQEAKGPAKSFDDLVDKNGALKPEKKVVVASTTAAEPQVEESGLRKRNIEMTSAAALGSAMANPFADEAYSDLYGVSEPSLIASRSSTPTLPSSPPPVPPKLPLDKPLPSLQINTSQAPSTHSSEQLIDLTPTTSAAASSSSLIPTNNPISQSETRQNSNYWSVHEWAENTAPSFYSPPRSEAAVEQRADVLSEAGSGELVSERGEHEIQEGSDVISEIGSGIDTPSSWTEVGSVVSEEY